MKKTYIKPVAEAVMVEFSQVCTSNNGIGDSGTGDSNITGNDAKERTFEEDNEAYNVTGGEGMSTYGDLW